MGISALLPLTVAQTSKPKWQKTSGGNQPDMKLDCTQSQADVVDRSGILKTQGSYAGNCHLKLWTGSSYRVLSEYVKDSADIRLDYRVEFVREQGNLKLRVFRRDVECVRAHFLTEYRWFRTIHRESRTMASVWHLVHEWSGYDLRANVTHPFLMQMEAMLGEQDQIWVDTMNRVALLTR